METNVSEVYQLLAVSILDSAGNNNDWKKAMLKLTVLENVVEYNLSFFNSNDDRKGARFNIPDSSDLSEKIISFQKVTTGEDNNGWNRAVFTLDPKGKFDMEFIWDQELNDEIEG